MIKNKTFYITYFATKHKTFITRKAKWTDDCKTWLSKNNKPDGTEGKSLVDKNGNKRLIYWDLDAEPNANGNRWRQAVGEVSIKYE